MLLLLAISQLFLPVCKRRSTEWSSFPCNSFLQPTNIKGPIWVKKSFVWKNSLMFKPSWKKESFILKSLILQNPIAFWLFHVHANIYRWFLYKCYSCIHCSSLRFTDLMIRIFRILALDFITVILHFSLA